MSADLLLGIDSGTSVAKAVLFNLQGEEVAAAHRPMPLLHPRPDTSEVDMVAVWEATADAVREAVGAVDPERIAAIGISGTACGVWAIDEAGKPVRTAILWNDGRAADVIARWQANGSYSRIFEIGGNAPFPGYPLSALAWLAEHEPQTLERARWFLFHKDWLRYNLTGDVCTDESDLTYFPVDIHSRNHSDELLALAGLTAYRDRLPQAHPSQQVVGAITASASARTGLREGTPVVAGSVDVVASALGGGIHQVGQACGILGTSFLNSLLVAQPTFTPVESGVQAAMPGGGWLRSVVNTSGTINIDWMVAQLASEERNKVKYEGGSVYTYIEAEVSQVPAGARGVVYLPYLSTAGIVSPFAEPNARGMFFGVSADTTRADLMRAVYDGTGLAMRDCFDAIGQPVDQVVLVGGGARSAFWAQVFADATGRRIVIPDGTEFGARGVALLAGVGSGVFASFAEEVAQTVRVARSYEPQPDAAKAYDALYPLYRHLYQTSREAWRLRAQILHQL